MITITMAFSTVLSLALTCIYNLPVAWIILRGYNIIAPHFNLPTDFTFLECYFVWLSLVFILDKIIPSITVNKKD